MPLKLRSVERGARGGCEPGCASKTIWGAGIGGVDGRSTGR